MTKDIALQASSLLSEIEELKMFKDDIFNLIEQLEDVHTGTGIMAKEIVNLVRNRIEKVESELEVL